MKFGIIGNDQMALSCIQILQEIPDAEIVFFLYDLARLNSTSSTQLFCTQNSIESKGIYKLNNQEVCAYILGCKPDCILSINNFWVIGEQILAIPKFGTINFHNSTPSRYHGLNIPSWVIINGEKRHGVMWHFVENKIDTGDVIRFEEFPLSRNETASSLMVKCIIKGIELFPDVIDMILKNNIIRIPQLPNASYYGKNNYPKDKGYINFDLTGKEIVRLIRGLNYLPFNNTFLYAKIRYNEKELIINSVKTKEHKKATTPGKVLFIDDNNLYVECKDSTICIIEAMDDNYNEYTGTSIAEYLNLKIGDIFKL
jgi:methionyl-tRNA formyltransferase